MSDKVIYRELTDGDSTCISRLHAHVFGPGRFARTAYRVREQSGAAALVSPLCRAAFLGNRLVASVTMTPVAIGPDCEALLLGPLAVDPEFAGQGYGRRLVEDVIRAARAAGKAAIILVGDESYYGRFGFTRLQPGQVVFPGPVDRGRILGLELHGGPLDALRGRVTALQT